MKGVMKQIYVIHPGYKGSTWEDCRNSNTIWVGNWWPDKPLGDLQAAIPAAWQGPSKQTYLQHFSNRTFDASAGRQGSHAARMLRKFYGIPVGSIVIATGQGKALGVANISSIVKYRDNGIDREGHADEDYVREVTEWQVLDVPSNTFARPIRSRLFHPFTVFEFPPTLWRQFVSTIVRKKGQDIGKRVEGLF